MDSFIYLITTAGSRSAKRADYPFGTALMNKLAYLDYNLWHRIRLSEYDPTGYHYPNKQIANFLAFVSEELGNAKNDSVSCGPQGH